MPKYRSKTDLKNIKKIAETVGALDISNLGQVERQLTNYIKNNARTQDPEKQKKLNAAKILLPFFKKEGRLKTIKEDLQKTITAVDDFLAENQNLPEVLPEEIWADLNIDLGINVLLDNISVDGVKYNIPQIEEALTTFMEADNFAEYQDDSPLRKINEAMKTCTDAYNGMNLIIEGSKQNRHIDYKMDDYMKQAWDEHQKKFADPLVIAYGDIKYGQAEEELKKLPSPAAIQKEIEQLAAEYGQALFDEENARADSERYNKEIVQLREQYDKEIVNSVKGAKQKQSQEDMKQYLNTLAMISLAYDKVAAARAKDPNAVVDVFEESRQDAQAYQKAQDDLKALKESFDTERFANSLIDEKDPGRAAGGFTLGNFIDDAMAGIQEQRKWAELYASFTTFKSAFGHDPVIMNYIVSSDPDLQFAASKKLINEYSKSNDPDKNSLYKLATEIKSRQKELSDEKTMAVFSFDGKGDQKKFMDDLEKTLSSKSEEARVRFARENELYRAYLGYKNTTKEIARLSEEMNVELEKGQEADVEKIKKLTEKQAEFSKMNSEYVIRLNSVGIKDPEVIKKAEDFARHKLDNEKSQIKKAEEKVDNTRKKAAESKKEADRIRKAIDHAKTSKRIMGVPEAAGFIEILESKNPDYSKLPKSNKIFQDIYDQKVVYNRKEVSRVSDELRNKISDLESRKTAADQVLKEGRSEKLLQKLTEKKYEKDMLEKKYEQLKKQDVRVKGLANKTKEFMASKYEGFNKWYEDSPKNLTSAEYKRIYSEIKKFRRDFSKCMKSEYARDPEGKNSPEFKSIMTALKAFGEKEADFNKLTVDEIKSKMSDLNHAATEYKRLKLAQTRLIWSSQRRYRLDYSDRIAKFTDQEMNTNLEILKNTNDPQNTADINRIYEEYHRIDPNAMVQSNGEPKPKDDRTIVVQVSGRISFDKIDNINKDIVDRERKVDEMIEKTMTEASRIKGMKNEDLAIILYKLDTLQRMKKEVLRDHDVLAEVGKEKAIENADSLLNAGKLDDFSRKMLKKRDGQKYLNMAKAMDKDKLMFSEGAENLLKERDLAVCRQQMKEYGKNVKITQDMVKLNQTRREVQENREVDLGQNRNKKKTGEDSAGIANEIIENKGMKVIKKSKPRKPQM